MAKKKQQENHPSVGKRLGLAVGSMASVRAGKMFGQGRSARISEKLISMSKGPATAAQQSAADKLRKVMPKGVKEITTEEAARGFLDRLAGGRFSNDQFMRSELASQFKNMGPAYVPKLKSLINTKKTLPEALAHEMGHAKNHKTLGRFYEPFTTVSRVGAMASPFIAGAGLAAHFLHKDRESKSAKRTRNISMGLAAAPVLGTLGEEAAASIRGARLLRHQGHKITPEQKRNLRRAWASYGYSLGTPLAVAGGIYGLDSLIRRHKKKKEQKEANNQKRQKKS